MADENMETNTTDTTEGNQQSGTTETQEASGKSFTQEELNAIVAKRVAQEQKRYEGVNLDEYRDLKAAQEKAETERLMKREEFDKVLKSTKEKYDTEVGSLRQELEKVKLDGTLKSVAGKLKTTNPDHVASLLRNQVKLDESGRPIVVNSDGEVRYNTDTAEPFTIENLVEEFVSENPYFRQPGKSGSGGDGNTSNQQVTNFDVSQLDLTKKEDREKYAQLKRDGKIRSF